MYVYSYVCVYSCAGLGVIPFFFSERVPKDVYLGVSNGALPVRTCVSVWYMYFSLSPCCHSLVVVCVCVCVL